MPLSDEAWAQIQAVASASAPAPADDVEAVVGEEEAVAPPAPPPQPQPPGVAERLVGATDPAMQAILAPHLKKMTPQGRQATEAVGTTLASARVADAASKATMAAAAGVKPRAPEVTLGDLWDMDPEQLEEIGWKGAADVVRKSKKLQATPTDGAGTVFGAEFGEQKADTLRTVPLQKMTGQLGMSPGLMEERLGQLYAMKEFRRRGTTFYKAEGPLRAAVIEESKDRARRDVASTLGRDEQRGNVLMDVRKSDEIIASARRGEVGAWPMYLTPMIGGTIGGAKAREALGGPAVEEQWFVNMWAPFIATGKLGQSSFQVEEGKPVLGAQREGKLSWIFRMAPSTAIASWMLDPEATWDLGGEAGWGGDRHLAKILGGYDVIQDIPRVGEMYDGITPWEASHLGKLAAAAIPLGAVILAEPDVISVGTAMAGAPIAKVAREVKLGKAVTKHAILPALKEMRGVVAKGGSLAELESVVGAPGSLKRMLYDAVAGDTIQRILAEAAGKGAALLPETAVKSGQDIERATTALAGRAEKTAEATARIGSEISAVQAKAAGEAVDANAKLSVLQAKTAEVERNRERAQEAMVAAAAIKASRSDLKEGAKLLDPKTGEILTVGPANRMSIKRNRAGEDIIEKLEVIKPDGSTARIRANSAYKMLDAKAAQDSPKLVDLLSLKRRREALKAAKAAAKEAGDAAEVKRINGELREITGSVINEGNKLAFRAAREAHDGAERAYQKHHKLLQKAAADAASGGAKTADRAAAVFKLIESMAEASSKEAVAARQLRAFENARGSLDRTLKQYELAFDAYMRAADRGGLEAGEFVGGVLANAVNRTGDVFRLNGPEYFAQLVRTYGSDVVDDVIKNVAGGVSIDRLVGRSGRINARQYQGLRSLEEQMFKRAEAVRTGEFKEASTVLNKLGDFKLMRGNSKEAWAAKTYQMARTLSRAGDWAGGSAIGKAPRAIREVLRRSFQRFQGSERELAMVNKSLGADGMRDFVVSNKKFDGVVSNQDVQTHADRALNYLRGLLSARKLAESRGEAGFQAWDEDLVVAALTAAPLPSFRSAVVAPGEASAAIMKMLEDPSLTGAQFVAKLEQVLPAIYTKQLGSTDSQEVINGFIYRALLQGSNLHDSLYDLARVTGPGIDADAAKAFNWFIQPEKKLAEVLDIGKAQKAAQQYNLPALREHAGEITMLGSAKMVQTRLMNAAVLAGQDHYIPEAMFRALQEVPRKLAKELVEFHTEGTRVGAAYDKITRLWRVATVNGWILPRAAHFVNTAAGDWSQMATSIGFREATQLTAQNLVTYVPFVGPRLQTQMLGWAEKNSLLQNVLNPALGVVMRAGDDVIDTAEGPMSARRFLKEAHEDGVYDSISTSDIAAITSRHQKSWMKDGIPGHIEATAKFMEELQYRQRLALYLKKRMAGESRGSAKDIVDEALYDFSTGVPAWEHKMIGRLSAFWSYRRGMMRQLGSVAFEGISDPSAQYFAKAMTGQTKLARMRQTGKILSGIPDAIYWQDPNEYLDDDEQLHVFGRQVAPWWADSYALIGNRKVAPERELWYSEVIGKTVTYESILLPQLTTLDQLSIMHMFAQTAMASSVMAAEAMGMRPNITTAGADKLWEELVDGFSDQLMPGMDDAVNNALRPLLAEGKHKSDKGTPIPQAQATMLRRLGWEEFMAAEPDADGRIRVDSTVLGIVTNIVLSSPPVADVARNWAVFDNPAMQDSLVAGMAEAAGRWTGLFKPHGHDPFKSADYEARAKESELKRARALLEKKLSSDRR